MTGRTDSVIESHGSPNGAGTIKAIGDLSKEAGVVDAAEGESRQERGHVDVDVTDADLRLVVQELRHQVAANEASIDCLFDLLAERVNAGRADRAALAKIFAGDRDVLLNHSYVSGKN